MNRIVFAALAVVVTATAVSAKGHIVSVPFDPAKHLIQAPLTAGVPIPKIEKNCRQGMHHAPDGQGGLKCVPN